MAISRFDTPADYTPINTYVPLPYQELAQGLLMKQKEFDEQVQKGQLAKALADRGKDLNEVAIGYDQKTGSLIKVPTAYAGMNAQMNQRVADQLNYFSEKDIAGDPAARKEYNNFLREVGSYYTSGTGAKITQAADKYNKIADKYAQNKALGKDLGFGTGENFFSRSGAVAQGDFGALDDDYNPLEHVDVYGKMEEFLKPVTANSTDAGRYLDDGYTKVKNGVESLDYYLNSKSKKYELDPKGKVFNTLKSYLYTPNNEFDNTVKRAYDNLVRTKQIDGSKTSYDQYKESKRVEYFDRALNANAYIKTKSDIDIDSGAYNVGKDKLEAEPIYTPTTNGAAFDNPNVAAPVKEINTEADKRKQDFKLQEYLKQQGIDTPGAGPRGTNLQPSIKGVIVSPEVWQQKKKELTEEFNKNYNGTPIEDAKIQYQRLQKVNPSFFKNEKEYVTAFNDAVKNTKNVTLPGEQLQPDQAKVYKQLLENSAASSLYKIAGEKEMLSIDQIAAKYNVTPDKIDIKPNKIHYDSVDPKMAGAGLEVTLSIKEGGNIPAITTVNNNLSEATKVITEISTNSIYKGIDTYTQEKPYKDPHTGNYIYTNTAPVGGKFKTQVHIIHPGADGQPTESVVDFDSFKEGVVIAAKRKLGGVINTGQTKATKDIKSFTPNPEE